MSYTLQQFGGMVTDPIRMGAYTEALKAAIKPGDIVLDIGTGPGTTALLCLELGAGHVFAIDPDPSVRLAKHIVELNGVSDRITVIEGVSQDFHPEKLMDVIVADLRDRLPMNGPSLMSMMDARDRLLEPGGVLLPTVDTMFVAPIEHPGVYESIVGPWAHDRFDMSPVIAKVVNLHEMRRSAPHQQVAPAKQWAEIDYRTITGPDVAGAVSWTIEADRTMHGYEIWFATEVGFGLGYSNAPDEPELVYGSEFFPLSEPLTLRAGDELHSELDARFLKGNYLWRWRTRQVRGGETVAAFDQSDLGASLDDPRQILSMQRPDHRPTLTDEALAERITLNAFAEGASVAEAVAELEAAAIGKYQGEVTVEFVKSMSLRVSKK